MKVLSAVLINFLLISNGLCQNSNSNPSSPNPQLIGGVRTSISSFPYIAGIFTRNFFTCGSAIINFRSVLTAAHCILSAPSDITVIVGTSRQDGRIGVTHRVSNVFMHPSYQGADSQLIADIAVVRTIFPFSFNSNVRSIPLGPNMIIGSNERVTVAGWGMLSNYGQVADTLHALDMTTISNLLCSSMHQNTFTSGWVTSEKICTLGLQLNSGICAGDSGSPLVFRGAVIGVASWTMRPCAENPSVFIRTANHLNWIRSYL